MKKRLGLAVDVTKAFTKGAVNGVVKGAVASVVGYGIGSIISDQEIDLDGIVSSAIRGGVAGAVFEGALNVVFNVDTFKHNYEVRANQGIMEADLDGVKVAEIIED